MKAGLVDWLKVVRVNVMLRDLLGVPGLQQWYACGGGSTGEVRSLTSQGENPRSGLNWLCLTMFLLEALF
jgi:hypothetical protein